MSAPGRTKGARSLKSTKFDNKVIGVSLEKRSESQATKLISLREENVLEKYEVLTSVPQRELILDELNSNMMDLLPARYWEYKKLWWFVFCFISALFGIGTSLWAMGETVLFADRKPDVGLLLGCCTFFLPCLCWVKVVFLPHGRNAEHLREMTEKREFRRKDDALRYEHLEGRLPRPAKEVEIPDAPFEYNPDTPWLYIRWKPKPKIYYHHDDEGLAHQAAHGSAEEQEAINRERKMQAILKAAERGHKKLADIALESAEEGMAEGFEGFEDLLPKKSSVGS